MSGKGAYTQVENNTGCVSEHHITTQIAQVTVTNCWEKRRSRRAEHLQDRLWFGSPSCHSSLVTVLDISRLDVFLPPPQQDSPSPVAWLRIWNKNPIHFHQNNDKQQRLYSVPHFSKCSFHREKLLPGMDQILSQLLQRSILSIRGKKPS